MFTELLIASGIVILVSLSGILTVWNRLGAFVEKNLNYLVSFASGVFVVLAFVLSQEVLVHAHNLLDGVLWIATGLVAVVLIVKIFPEGHHHTEDKAHEPLKVRKLLIGDSLHNIGDGVLLAVAFTASTTLGVAAAASIIFHETVQEISEFFILRKAGYTVAQALRINAFTASTILIGSVGGYFFLETFSSLEIPALGLATGALIAVLAQDLIPHSLRSAQEKKCTTKHLTAAGIGAVLMLSIFVVTAPAHDHSHNEHAHEHEAHLDEHHEESGEDHHDHDEHDH